ncbi:hypothetical protein TWF506_003804 [Arthrobotrys conoides]|uniref:Actin-like ATPase domain-containing protein n=1 Tax=Arthrobotrys conoides TaxID=74498 RepID=A0AAN8RK59_9PEZI
MTGDPTGLSDIIQCDTWGGKGGVGTTTALKTPSRIAYSSENPSLRENQWGYGIDAGVRQCAWMKLLLDRNATVGPFDDPDLKGDIEMGRISLPTGKTAEDVTSDYLKELYDHIMQTLQRRMGNVLDLTEIRFWLTKPAIWSDEAESKTLTAAKKAGFGSRPNVKDEICLILEPEAGALASVSSLGRSRAVKPGDSIVICDCGGGTVDLTAYIIEALKPKLSLRESCPAIGGKCGGTSVDRQLVKWLSERYKDAFLNLDEKWRGPGSRFMKDFELNKKKFGTGEQLTPMTLPMDHDDDEDGDLMIFDGEEGSLNLNDDIMTQLFEPVIKNIKSLIQKQVDSAKKATQQNVNKILLVGGFGDSAYLKQQLERHLQPQGITVHVPHQSSWGAVAKGAVLRGLEAASVDLRKSRRSYGINISNYYIEGVHDPKERYTDSFGRVLVPNYMTWAITKGSEINDKTRISIPLEQIIYLNGDKEDRTKLYCCDEDIAPERGNDSVKEIGCIVADLSNVDFSTFEKRRDRHGELVKLQFEILIILGGKQGTVYFQFCIGGKIVGTAEIEYTKST